MNLKFQSTRPVRDATVPTDETIYLYGSFNPRVPCGTRLGYVKITRLLYHVSIHASRAGRDIIVTRPVTRERVSIHASRAGRDVAYSVKTGR